MLPGRAVWRRGGKTTGDVVCVGSLWGRPRGALTATSSVPWARPWSTIACCWSASPLRVTSCCRSSMASCFPPWALLRGAEREATPCLAPFAPHRVGHGGEARLLRPTRVSRSEEHTSELQSLMRISHAVFCLKKKKKTTTYHTQHRQSTDQNTV